MDAATKTSGSMRTRNQRGTTSSSSGAAATSSPSPLSRPAAADPGSSPTTTMRGTTRMPDRDPASSDPRRNGSVGRHATRISSFRTGAASSPSHASRSLGASSGSFLGDSWASMTDFASSLFSSSPQDGSSSSSRMHMASNGAFRSRSQNPRSAPQNRHKQRPGIPSAWGPEPPADYLLSGAGGRSRQTMDHVAAGSRAEIDAALTAARRASVLESYDGVNGGLDVSGKSRYKRRNSDDAAAAAAAATADDDGEVQDQLVYIHHVAPVDTMAGLVLKYHCREDVLKKANGMWSNDVQLRKRLFVPVDMCQVKGKACAAPAGSSNSSSSSSSQNQSIDPAAAERKQQQELDDLFMSPSPESASLQPQPQNPSEPDKPWQHVRWVALEAFSAPTEIGRMSKKALGYFPPRRKKSSRMSTASPRSSPRQSLDEAPLKKANGRLTTTTTTTTVATKTTTTAAAAAVATDTRLSTAAAPGHSRGPSSAPTDDALPAWMRKAGGVGSLSVRAPGPANDILNTWAKKHIPGLSMEAVPSMAIMGTETASIGIPRDLSGTLAAGAPPSAAAAAEAAAAAAGGTDDALARSLHSAGAGLDRMAAAMETWVRGALAKAEAAAASSPLAMRRAGGPDVGTDLIELGDNMSDDGQPPVFSLALDTGVGAASGFAATAAAAAATAEASADGGAGGVRARKGGKSN